MKILSAVFFFCLAYFFMSVIILPRILQFRYQPDPASQMQDTRPSTIKSKIYTSGRPYAAKDSIEPSGLGFKNARHNHCN